MIPVVIIWLAKKCFRKQRHRQYIKFLLTRIIAVTVLLLFSFTLFSQELTHKYAVMYGDENVGSMQLYIKKCGDETYMRMVSDVQMRFIFKIAVKSEEEACFKD